MLNVIYLHQSLENASDGLALCRATDLIKGARMNAVFAQTNYLSIAPGLTRRVQCDPEMSYRFNFKDNLGFDKDISRGKTVWL